MSTLLEKVRGVREGWSRSLREACKPERDSILAIAIRDAFGQPQDDDADTLAQSMNSLSSTNSEGVSDNDYQALVKSAVQVSNAVANLAVREKDAEGIEKRIRAARIAVYTVQAEVTKAQWYLNDLKGVKQYHNSAKAALENLRKDAPQFFDEAGNPVAELRPHIDSAQKQIAERCEAKRAEGMARSDEWLANTLRRFGLAD